MPPWHTDTVRSPIPTLPALPPIAIDSANQSMITAETITRPR